MQDQATIQRPENNLHKEYSEKEQALLIEIGRVNVVGKLTDLLDQVKRAEQHLIEALGDWAYVDASERLPGDLFAVRRAREILSDARNMVYGHEMPDYPKE